MSGSELEKTLRLRNSPGFLRFLAGAKELGRNSITRWHDQSEDWEPYDLRKWGMLDLGLPDTSPGYALTFDGNQWTVSEVSLPNLYARLIAVAANYRRRYPTANLVWTPRGGGDWRHALQLDDIPIGGDGNHSGIMDPPCLERVEAVREYERRGHISGDQARRLIEEIIADCT